MATFYLREYKSMVSFGHGVTAPAGHEDGSCIGQKHTFSTSTPSDAFAGSTNFVRIIADADSFLEIGASPTATTNNGLFVPANTAYFFGVEPGMKVAVYDGVTT